ncbi:pectate lyase [Streptomyces griseoruber]
MTASAEPRIRHRRSVTGRRALIAGSTALGITGAALVTTTPLSSAGATTAWPTATGSNAVPSTIKVSGTHDGRLRKFYGKGALGTSDQDESQGALFELADGAVLKNVIIGSPAADGVHCKGSCTLRNVWWPDVGEDAASFKGTSSSAVYKVIGGGAHVVLSDIDVVAPLKAIVGVNANHGDTATLSKIRIQNDPKKKVRICVRFQGNNTDREPTEIGSGADGTTCRFSSSALTYK